MRYSGYGDELERGIDGRLFCLSLVFTVFALCFSVLLTALDCRMRTAAFSENPPLIEAREITAENISLGIAGRELTVPVGRFFHYAAKRWMFLPCSEKGESLFLSAAMMSEEGEDALCRWAYELYDGKAPVIFPDIRIRRNFYLIRG